MAPKKKSKANKLARMSEEEKLRYLQHRAAVEEEAKRRKEHIISSYMKNKLKHEEAFTRLNTAKINQQWRQTLRQIKNKELHDATETLRQIFEVALKTKNKIIDNLVEDLDDSEKQHCLAVKTHLVAVDKLLGIQSGRMDTVSDNYNSARDRKLAQALKERQRLEKTYEEDKTKLTTMIFWEEECNKNNNDALKTKGVEYKDDAMHQLMSETRELEIQGKQEMEELKKEMQNVFEEYHKKFEPFETHYRQLCETDKQNVKTYNQNNKIIEEYQELIKKLKKDNEISKLKGLEEIEDLKAKIKEQKKIHFDMRKEVEQESIGFKKLIQQLSINSNEAINHLKELENTIDSIMNYVDNSKRYLNEKELILPDVPKEIDSDAPLIEMTHFWTKHGGLQVEVTNLEAYYANYLEENVYLKKLLQQYLNTVSRPTSIPNSVFRNKELLKAKSTLSIKQ